MRVIGCRGRGGVVIVVVVVRAKEMLVVVVVKVEVVANFYGHLLRINLLVKEMKASTKCRQYRVGAKVSEHAAVHCNSYTYTYITFVNKLMFI